MSVKRFTPAIETHHKSGLESPVMVENKVGGYCRIDDYQKLEDASAALKEENEAFRQERKDLIGELHRLALVEQSLKARVAELEEENTELRVDLAKLKDRDVQAIANKICRQIPSGYEIRLCMENGAGYVELYTPNNDSDRSDFDCGIYSQLVCALEVAEELSEEPVNEG